MKLAAWWVTTGNLTDLFQKVKMKYVNYSIIKKVNTVLTNGKVNKQEYEVLKPLVEFWNSKKVIIEKHINKQN